jgi:hypothetical protein
MVEILFDLRARPQCLDVCGDYLTKRLERVKTFDKSQGMNTIGTRRA